MVGKENSEKLPPILRLPPSVRHRIYRFVGLVSPRERQHRFDLHGRIFRYQAPKPSTFHGLLLSCRVVYVEAAALLYSSSQFIIRYDPAHTESLQPLHALTTTALASLTSLTIILNQASCRHYYEDGIYNFCCLGGKSGPANCQRYHSDSHQLPLLARPTGAQPNDDPEAYGTDGMAAAHNLLGKWLLEAACLASITSGRLELALVCDIDPHHERALEIASLVTTPLRLMPQLRDCHIRLCKTPDSHLWQTARDSALQACHISLYPSKPSTGKPSTGTQATFTSLPCELRLRILEYTDLIVPNKEVTWSRQDQRYSTPAAALVNNHYLRRFFQCRNSRRPRSFIGCFCRRRHAAFSSMHRCWSPPGPMLFLVCRSLCEDARLTFFSGNRFIVHDFMDDPPWEVPSHQDSQETGGPAPRCDYPGARFAASQFLREVVPAHCLGHMRFLELVFPPYLAQTRPRAGHPAIQDWRETVG